MSCDSCSGCQRPSCRVGYHGITCDLLCSRNCHVLQCTTCECEVCDVTSGQCSNGCAAGSFGRTCDQMCPPTCSNGSTFQQHCDFFSGKCTDGCARGFYGDWCNVTCSPQCDLALCNQTTGDCLQGCLQGYSGHFCNETVVTEEAGPFAGVMGGAFVVILWAVIIVFLICFIWRKRLKDFAVFNRNIHIGNGKANRSSSRRHLRRHSSNSSMAEDAGNYPPCGEAVGGVQVYMDDDQADDTTQPVGYVTFFRVPDSHTLVGDPGGMELQTLECTPDPHFIDRPLLFYAMEDVTSGEVTLDKCMGSCSNEHVTSCDKHMTSCNEHMTQCDKHMTSFNEHVTSCDKHMTSCNEHDTLCNEHGTLCNDGRTANTEPIIISVEESQFVNKMECQS